MRTKNTIAYLRDLTVIAEGRYVCLKEAGLDQESMKEIREEIAVFAERKKQKEALGEASNNTEEEVSESDSQEGQDETAKPEEEVQKPDQNTAPEEEAEVTENPATALEKTREPEDATNRWVIVNNEYADIQLPEDPEHTHTEVTETEVRERAEQEELLRREEKARGKRIREDREQSGDPDFEIEDEVAEAEIGPSKKKKKIEEPEFTPDEYYQAFKATGFLGTRYPDMDLMRRLGIDQDVEGILRAISMDRFAVQAYPTYPKLACEFLSTLEVAAMPSKASQKLYGGGMINFTIKGKPVSLHFKDIDEFFGFKEGKPEQLNVSEEDRIRIWSCITGKPGEQLPDKLPTQPKGTMIRNPAINYARRIIAETFFSRSDAGTISSQDTHLLASSLSKLIELKPPLSGDTADASLSFVLCKHLESFKAKVQTITRKGQTMAKMTIGGAITGLLTLAGVDFTKHIPEEMPPRNMGIAYLRVQSFLAGPKGIGNFYYQFPHPSDPAAAIGLPEIEATDLTKQRNFVFIPPKRLLKDLSALPSPPEKTPTAKISSAGPSKQKKEAAHTPTGRGPATKTCVCTQPGYRETLAADIERSLQEKFRRQLADFEWSLQRKHEQDIAKLTKTFMKRPMFPRTPPRRALRAPPPFETRTKRPLERPTARPSTGFSIRTKDDEDDEDTDDTLPLSKRAANIRHKHQHPAFKGA